MGNVVGGFDLRSGILLSLGVCLVAVALSPAGGEAVTELIVAGAGAIAAAVIAPHVPHMRLQELELGLGAVKAKLAAEDEAFHRSFAAKAEELQRFAWLVCGDPEEARDLVEETLAEARREQRRLRADERGAYALRVLVERLETAAERRWLRGSRPPRRQSRVKRGAVGCEQATIDALATLGMGSRITYLLRYYWPLPLDEVAAIVGRSCEEVTAEVTAATERLKHLMGVTTSV